METPDRSNDVLNSHKVAFETPGTASIDSYSTATAASPDSTNHLISSNDVSMTDAAEDIPQAPSSPRNDFKFPFNLDTPPASERKGNWISRDRGHWSEKPHLPRSSPVKSSRKRRSTTIPVNVPIANRATQSWIARHSVTATPTTTELRPIKKRRRHKITIPLDCPIADRPTKSWLAKHGQLQSNESGHLKNKRQGNYLPSTQLKRQRIIEENRQENISDTSSLYSMSTQAFPPAKHLFQFTTPDIVKVAERSTEAWESKLRNKFVKKKVICPHLNHRETLKTPNGQYFLYNNTSGNLH